jgi:8-oxo-dGTP pyrophosphatase MutT (NUDIX family)
MFSNSYLWLIFIPVMEFIEFVISLEDRLKKPLPGRPAQLRMSSLVRIQELMKFSPPSDYRQSSVLILLYPFEDGIGIVLTLRPEYKGIHSGQISLPGGKYEEGDESLIYTALREAKEEIGIDPVQVQIIGQLTEMYIPPSHTLVTPVVGYQVKRPRFKADPKEVARIIEIKLTDLLDERKLQIKKMKLSLGFSLKVPAYFIDGNYIWGATAMILSELKEAIRDMG